MEFKSEKEDGKIHIFNVTSQVLIMSYCGEHDHHYKEDATVPAQGGEMCTECVRIAGVVGDIANDLVNALHRN